MMNTRKLVLISFLLLITGFSHGQEEERSRHDKVKSLKIAYITERLDLTSDEAQVFWPIYNAYDKERHQLRQQEREEIRDKIRDVRNLSEKEATQLLQEFSNFKKMQEKLESDFITEIQKVISAKKTLLLIRAEEGFKRRLLKQYHEKRSKGKR